MHSPSPSHSAPSSPLKASHKQAHKNNVDSLPSPSTAGRPKKSGKRNGKVKSGVKTEGNIVVMDVDEAPDLMHTHAPPRGFHLHSLKEFSQFYFYLYCVQCNQMYSITIQHRILPSSFLFHVLLCGLGGFLCFLRFQAAALFLLLVHELPL